MPNIKSAKKRMRTSEEARQRNISVKTSVKNCRRKFKDAMTAGDKGTCEAALKVYSSVLDRAANKGIIKKNTASRRKARATVKVNAL